MACTLHSVHPGCKPVVQKSGVSSYGFLLGGVSLQLFEKVAELVVVEPRGHALLTRARGPWDRLRERVCVSVRESVCL